MKEIESIYFQRNFLGAHSSTNDRMLYLDYEPLNDRCEKEGDELKRFELQFDSNLIINPKTFLTVNIDDRVINFFLFKSKLGNDIFKFLN